MCLRKKQERTWSNLFVPSGLDITTVLLGVKSFGLCTISTVVSWKHKLQDSCKGKAILFILFHFWFIMGLSLFQSLPVYTYGSCGCSWAYKHPILQYRKK